MQDKALPESHQQIGRVNYWLSKKRQGRWEDVKKEASNADFSAKGLKFQLALAALNDRSDEFFSLLPRALQAEEISKSQINEFPVFEEMREDERFHQYRKVAEEFPLTNGTEAPTSSAETVHPLEVASGTLRMKDIISQSSPETSEPFD